MRKHFTPSLFASLCLIGAALVAPRTASAQDRAEGTEPESLLLFEAMRHLGDSKVEKWPDAVPDEPEGKRLDFTFEAARVEGLRCLVIRHYHVDNEWDVVLNGKKVAVLKRRKELGDYRYLIPGDAFRDGTNTLAIEPRKPTDDITVGRVRLYKKPLREALKLGVVAVQVVDHKGLPMPARITIVDEQQALPEVFFADGDQSASRAGIVYTTAKVQRFEVSEGKYRIDVSRGTEWSRASAEIHVKAAETTDLKLTLQHEVATLGYVAADTHIHTYEFSGHGDASLVERLVTLAGEGVELAIATDHNHNIDYRPEQARLGLSEYYTSVVGNEVTTSMGHFNAFPLDPKDKVPEHRLSDWIKVIDGMRAKGARVVILNHPRWPDIEKGPFGRFRLNQLSGERASGPSRLTFDAMELVNATTEIEDPLFLFRDWFALLNYGERIFAVGSSDSHTVGDPVGQGRTYVPSKSDDPVAIDVEAACEAFRNGRTSISMGIITDVKVGEGAGIGDTVVMGKEAVELEVRVAAPSWVRPRFVHVFVNGVLRARRAVPPEDGAATGKAVDTWLPFEIAAMPHDAWVVCVVTGDPIREAFWKTLNGYTLAATNPVWLDGDGIRGYSPPRETARRMFESSGADPAKIASALARVDEGIGIQLLSLVRSSFPRAERHASFERFVTSLEPASETARRYLATLAAPEEAPKK